MKSIMITAAACLVFATPKLAAASLYLETFSTDNDTSGWSRFSNGTVDSLVQNTTQDNLEAGANDYTILYAIADSTSSTGAFVGDFTTAGVGAFRFDLLITAGSSVTNLFFELNNFTDSETWAYHLALPAFDTMTTYSVPLGGAGWTQSSGSQPFSYILANTEEIAIGFENDGSGSILAKIDNVETIPEPSAFFLLGGAALLSTTRRRRPTA